MKAAVEFEYRRFFIYPDYSLFFILDKKQKRGYYFLKAASAGATKRMPKP
jgi:hypothetical protein